MTELKPARAELLALAAKVRDQDWARHLDGALTAAATAGWDWRRAGREACRLIFGTDDAEPREIIDATRNPLDNPRPAAPEAKERLAAEARATMGTVVQHPRWRDPSERALEQVAKSRHQRHAELDDLEGDAS